MFKAITTYSMYPLVDIHRMRYLRWSSMTWNQKQSTEPMSSYICVRKAYLAEKLELNTFKHTKNGILMEDFTPIQTILMNSTSKLYLTKNIILDLPRTVVPKELLSYLLKGDKRLRGAKNTKLFSVVQQFI